MIFKSRISSSEKKLYKLTELGGGGGNSGNAQKNSCFSLRRTSLSPNKESSIEKNCTAPPSWSRLSPRARVGQLLQCKCRVWAGAAATQDSSANLNISRMWRNSRVAKSNIEKTQEQRSEKGGRYLFIVMGQGKKLTTLFSFPKQHADGEK